MTAGRRNNGTDCISGLMENIDANTVRLRLVEALLPACSRVQLTNPDDVVKIATTLEQYVLGVGNPKPAHKGPKKGKGGTPGGPLA